MHLSIWPTHILPQVGRISYTTLLLPSESVHGHSRDSLLGEEKTIGIPCLFATASVCNLSSRFGLLRQLLEWRRSAIIGFFWSPQPVQQHPLRQPRLLTRVISPTELDGCNALSYHCMLIFPKESPSIDSTSAELPAMDSESTSSLFLSAVVPRNST